MLHNDQWLTKIMQWKLICKHRKTLYSHRSVCSGPLQQAFGRVVLCYTSPSLSMLPCRQLMIVKGALFCVSLTDSTFTVPGGDNRLRERIEGRKDYTSKQSSGTSRT